jgi:hypothetical protein
MPAERTALQCGRRRTSSAAASRMRFLRERGISQYRTGNEIPEQYRVNTLISAGVKRGLQEHC